MNNYAVRQVGEYLIEYSEGDRAINLEIDWRDPVPAFSFEQVTCWNPPYDQEPIDRITQLQILQRISDWLRQHGYERIYISGYGYVDATD